MKHSSPAPKLLIIAAALFVFSTCTSIDTSSSQPNIILTDALDRDVTLEDPARRIISLAASNTEIIFAVGAGKYLVGRDEYSDYPPAALSITSIGSLYPKVNAEAVVALEPDLVLAAAITNPKDVTALSDLGLTVFTTGLAVTLDDIYTDIIAIGILTGQETNAKTLVNDMQERIRAVTDATSHVDKHPRIFYEIDASDPTKPWTPGPGSLIDTIIGLVGGSNIGAARTDPYWQISLEQLIHEDPEVVLLGSSTFGGQTPDLVAQRPGWDSLLAVKRGTVYVFDDNLISRPGPRVAEGLELLAHLIHPDKFK